MGQRDAAALAPNPDFLHVKPVAQAGPERREQSPRGNRARTQPGCAAGSASKLLCACPWSGDRGPSTWATPGAQATASRLSDPGGVRLGCPRCPGPRIVQLVRGRPQSPKCQRRPRPLRTEAPGPSPQGRTTRFPLSPPAPALAPAPPEAAQGPSRDGAKHQAPLHSPGPVARGGAEGAGWGRGGVHTLSGGAGPRLPSHQPAGGCCTPEGLFLCC